MALDAGKIKAGAGVFSYGDYVAAGGAGSLSDAGHVKSPFELATAMENFDDETERVTGIVLTNPIKTDHTLKVALHQVDAALFQMALGLPAANRTGTAPNETVLVGDRVAQFHQATLVVPGEGTTGSTTFTFWKLQVISVEPIQFGKGVSQMLAVTFRALRDDTVTSLDKHYKRVAA